MTASKQRHRGVVFLVEDARGRDSRDNTMPVGLPVCLCRTIVLAMALSGRRTAFRTWGPASAAEMLGHQRQGFVRIDVAENRHDHVVGHEVLGVILPQVLGREAFDRFGLAALR